jgi:serine/threonine-protein kinase
VLHTVVIGALSVACLFVFARESIAALDPLVFDGLTVIGGAFVLATGVTSHVIYGLRREIREALRLGQYVLEEKLGEGGMGTVHRARHALLRRQAAIKLIRPELTGTGTERTRAIERFEREAQVTATLKSPHTVELYDFGVSTDGAFYYVMELLDGIDLESAVSAHGPMPPERVIHLLRQACNSLGEAHAAGPVHRDIKPANVVACRHGVRHDVVKVLDFGLVSLAPRPGEADAKLTTDGFAGGTPAYMAPEMVTAFGVPAPPALEALVLACLEKTSAAELSARLEAALDGEAWSEERAAAWWAAHRPEGMAPHGEAEHATVEVARVTRG